jgi:hypothetical protein
LFLAAGLLFPVTSVRAQESIDCAQSMVYAANDQGYRLRSYDTSRLAQGDVMNYPVTLVADVEYMIMACGERTARDVDIYLYDENGNLIDRDRLEDNKPIVHVTPIWTGPFIIQVKMYAASRSSYFTLAVMYAE